MPCVVDMILHQGLITTVLSLADCEYFEAVGYFYVYIIACSFLFLQGHILLDIHLSLGCLLYFVDV